MLTSNDQRYLTEGFVITEGGRYRGLGTREQLVRAVTEARIEASRHANLLTFLPGNIPISDHIELARQHFDQEALDAGGIMAEDRHGVVRFHPCTTLCIGAVQVAPGRFRRSDDVPSAAAATKRHAKRGGFGFYLLDAPDAAMTTTF